jgi:tripartite-type tricarboxylate transporter receptor subunit TctC
MRATPFAATILLILAFAGHSPRTANAQPWPTQAIKIITPFPPGSGGDITVRPIAEALAKKWGKPVVVDNRPGADGILAVTAVLNSNDGHTLLYTNGGPLTSNQLSHDGKLPYNPAQDLLAVSASADVFVGIGVPASLAVTTLNDFVELAKSRPRQFNWGGTPGSLDYLVPGFFKRAGIELTQVHYRDLTTATQDLSQSRLQFYVAAVASQLPMAQSGMTKIIAVTNQERAPSLPDVPTVAEAGFPELRYEAFLGFFAPRGTPADLRNRISFDVQAVVTEETLKAKFQTMGMKAHATTPVELERIVTDERAVLERLVRPPQPAPAQ